MDPNPVVILVVRLLTAAAMTNDRIPFTKRASAYDDLVAVFRPVGGKLVRRDGNWDKVDRTSQGFRLCLRPPRSSTEAEPRLLMKNPTERKYTSYLQTAGCDPGYWPVISLLSTVDV
jgi:hypothetical protein